MDLNLSNHKKSMDSVYKNPKFPEAIDLWATYFAKNKEQVRISNWRHLNAKRQGIENKIFKEFIKPKNKILDIGCGRGFFLKRIFQIFGNSIEYYGIDISEEIINFAKDYFKNAKYLVSPGEKLPFENETFDYIQIISTLEHVLNPYSILKEAYRVLKKEGRLYVVVHKRAFDPLLISIIYNRLLNRSVYKKRKATTREINKDALHPLPLKRVRTELDRSAKKLGLKLIEKQNLISNIEFDFYLKYRISTSILLKLANIINFSPISIYKNLECRIYIKKIIDINNQNS